MGKERSTPRTVCCAIPIARGARQVLLITSRSRPEMWVCEYKYRFSIVFPIIHHIQCRGPPKSFGSLFCLTSFPNLAADHTVHHFSLCIDLCKFTKWFILKPNIVPKGGYETADERLEVAAQREALEEGPYPSAVHRDFVSHPPPIARAASRPYKPNFARGLPTLAYFAV